VGERGTRTAGPGVLGSEGKVLVAGSGSGKRDCTAVNARVHAGRESRGRSREEDGEESETHYGRRVRS
jgi:hypothetical protein